MRNYYILARYTYEYIKNFRNSSFDWPRFVTMFEYDIRTIIIHSHDNYRYETKGEIYIDFSIEL